MKEYTQRSLTLIKFDEDTDISTTYLGQVDMTRNTEVKAEENFPMTARVYTRGQLLHIMMY